MKKGLKKKNSLQINDNKSLKNLKNLAISFESFWTFFVNNVVYFLQKKFLSLKWYKKNNYLYIYWFFLYFCFKRDFVLKKNNIKVKRKKLKLLKNKKNIKRNLEIFRLIKKKKNSIFTFYSSQNTYFKLFNKLYNNSYFFNKNLKYKLKYNNIQNFFFNSFVVKDYSIFFKRLINNWKNNTRLFKKKYFVFSFNNNNYVFFLIWNFNFLYWKKKYKNRFYFKNFSFFNFLIFVNLEKYKIFLKNSIFYKIKKNQFFLIKNKKVKRGQKKEINNILRELRRYRLVFKYYFNNTNIFLNTLKKNTLKKKHIQKGLLMLFTKISFIKKSKNFIYSSLYGWISCNKNNNFWFNFKYFSNFINNVYKNNLIIKYNKYQNWCLYLYFILIKYKKILLKKNKFINFFKSWKRRFFINVKQVSIKLAYKLLIFTKILRFLSVFAEFNFHNFFLLLNFKFLSYIQNFEMWLLDFQRISKWFFVNQKFRLYIFYSAYTQFLKIYKSAFIITGYNKKKKLETVNYFIKTQFANLFYGLFENNDIVYNIFFRPYRVGIFFRELYFEEVNYLQNTKNFYNKYNNLIIFKNKLLWQYKIKNILKINKQILKKKKLFKGFLKNEKKKFKKLFNKKIMFKEIKNFKNLFIKNVSFYKSRNEKIKIIKKKIKWKILKQSRVYTSFIKKINFLIKYKNWFFRKNWRVFKFIIFKNYGINKLPIIFFSQKNIYSLQKINYQKKIFFNFTINRFLFFSKKLYMKSFFFKINSLNLFYLYFKNVIILRYILKKKKIRLKPFFKLNFKFFKTIKYIMHRKNESLKFKYFKVFVYNKKFNCYLGKQLFIFKFIYFWIQIVFKFFFLGFLLEKKKKNYFFMQKKNSFITLSFFNIMYLNNDLNRNVVNKKSIHRKSLISTISTFVILKNILKCFYCSFNLSKILNIFFFKWYNRQILQFYSLLVKKSKKKFNYFIKIYAIFFMKFFIKNKWISKNYYILSSINIFNWLYIQYFIYFFFRIFIYKKYFNKKKKKKEMLKNLKIVKFFWGLKKNYKLFKLLLIFKKLKNFYKILKVKKKNLIVLKVFYYKLMFVSFYNFIKTFYFKSFMILNYYLKLKIKNLSIFELSSLHQNCNVFEIKSLILNIFWFFCSFLVFKLKTIKSKSILLFNIKLNKLRRYRRIKKQIIFGQAVYRRVKKHFFNLKIKKNIKLSNIFLKKKKVYLKKKTYVKILLKQNSYSVKKINIFWYFWKILFINNIDNFSLFKNKNGLKFFKLFIGKKKKKQKQSNVFKKIFVLKNLMLKFNGFLRKNLKLLFYSIKFFNVKSSQIFYNFFSGLRKYFFNVALFNYKLFFFKIFQIGIKSIFKIPFSTLSFWNIFLVLFLQLNVYLFNFFCKQGYLYINQNFEFFKVSQKCNELSNKLLLKNIESEILYLIKILKYFLNKCNISFSYLKFFYNIKLFRVFEKILSLHYKIFKINYNSNFLYCLNIFFLQLKIKKIDRIIVKYNKIVLKIIKKVYILNPFILKNWNLKTFLFKIKSKLFLLSSKNLFFINVLKKVGFNLKLFKNEVKVLKKKLIFFKVKLFFKIHVINPNIENFMPKLKKKTQMFYNSKIFFYKKKNKVNSFVINSKSNLNIVINGNNIFKTFKRENSFYKVIKNNCFSLLYIFNKRYYYTLVKKNKEKKKIKQNILQYYLKKKKIKKLLVFDKNINNKKLIQNSLKKKKKKVKKKNNYLILHNKYLPIFSNKKYKFRECLFTDSKNLNFIFFSNTYKKKYFNLKTFNIKFFFNGFNYKKLNFNRLKALFLRVQKDKKKPFFWNYIFKKRRRFGSIFNRLKLKYFTNYFRFSTIKNFWNIKLKNDQKLLFFNERFSLKKKIKLKYIKPIFYKEFKWRIFKYQYNKIRSFLRFTKFYKIKFRKLKQKNSKLYFPVLSRIYNYGQFGKPKTRIREFIMTRRSFKDGFSFWFGFSHKWLRNSVLQNKLSKFYFSPLRFKKTIVTKKLKYLRTYKRLFSLHPRVGKWITIGLVGNTLARNMIYLKKKVLLKIFSNLYYAKHLKIFKTQSKKQKRITSKFYSFLNNILNFFESRLDVIILRANFTPLIYLSRILVSKGYIDINFKKKKNIYYRLFKNDFISINSKVRNTVFEVRWERFEAFRNLYLFRYFKAPLFNIISMYISKILNSVSQMQERNFWFQSLAEVYILLDEYEVGLRNMSMKQVKNLQLNVQINPIFRFDKEIKKLALSDASNILWLRNENKIIGFSNVKTSQYLSKFKKKTLKRFYKKSIFEKLLIRKTQKNDNNYNIHIQILKQILKDLLIQTWQSFPKNLLINLPLRYAFIISNIVINSLRKFDNLCFYSVLNINYLHWFIQNI